MLGWYCGGIVTFQCDRHQRGPHSCKVATHSALGPMGFDYLQLIKSTGRVTEIVSLICLLKDNENIHLGEKVCGLYVLRR